MKRIITIAVIAASISSCSFYTLQEPTRVKVAGFYTVDPQIQWSRGKAQHIEIWTVDGPLLESIRFFDARKQGDTLFTPAPNKKLPTFNKDMKATEVQEFVVDTMASAGASGVEAYNLRPWKFGSLSGFRFELKYVNENGLEHSAFAVGAINDEKLYLILYAGTSMYYYPKYRELAESVVASIEIAA